MLTSSGVSCCFKANLVLAQPAACSNSETAVCRLSGRALQGMAPTGVPGSRAVNMAACLLAVLVMFSPMHSAQAGCSSPPLCNVGNPIAATSGSCMQSGSTGFPSCTADSQLFFQSDAIVPCQGVLSGVCFSLDNLYSTCCPAQSDNGQFCPERSI
jgi:hypothetical protein